MKYILKFTALVVALVTLGGIFAACGRKNNGGNTDSGSSDG